MNKFLAFWLFVAISAALVDGSALRGKEEDKALKEPHALEEKSESLFLKYIKKHSNSTQHDRMLEIEKNRELTLGVRRQTLLDLVLTTPQTATLASLVAYCDRGLIDDLGDPRGSWTVMAPRNYAFNLLERQIGEAAVDNLVSSREICNVVAYHILPGRLRYVNNPRSQWARGGPFQTRNPGNRVTTRIGITPGGYDNKFVDDVRASTVNVMANNGIAHVLNQVLIPGDLVIAVPYTP